MPSIDVDTTELQALAVDLGGAGDRLLAQLRPAVQQGADAVKAALRADLGQSAHFGQVARAVTYDLAGNAAYAEALIGPTKGSPGSLANIAYFGGANGGGGTVRDPLDSAVEQLPAIEAALGDAVTTLLG